MSSQSPPRQSPTPAGVPADPDPSATPRDKTVDKRKAPEKDSSDLDSSADITSLESPMKKPRIQDNYTPSKLSVMSPLCAGDDSPSKYPPQGGITDVTVPLGGIIEDQLLGGDSSDNNGVQIGAESDVNLSTSVEEAVTMPEHEPLKEHKEKAVQPTPKMEEPCLKTEEPLLKVEYPSLETVVPPVKVDDTSLTEVDPSGNVGKAKSESDSDSGSQFFSHIRQEQQRHKDEKESLVEKDSSISKPAVTDIPLDTSDHSSGSHGKKKGDKRKGESSRRGKTASTTKNRKNSSHSTSGGSANYSSSMDISSSSPRPVEFSIQIYDGKTKSLIYDTKDGRLKADYGTMKAFLKTFQVELPSFISTGYSADVSSPESGTFDFLNTPQKPRTTSLGSSIPRPSDASAISRPSIVGVQDTKKPVKQPTRPPRKHGDMEPILSSTRITDYKTPKPKNMSSSDNSVKKVKLDKTVDTSSNTVKTPVTNGGDHTAVGKSNPPAERGRGHGRRKVQSSTPVSITKTPIPHTLAEEELTPKRSAKSTKATKMDTSVSADKSALMFSDVSDIANLSVMTPSSQSEDLSGTASTSASASDVDPEVSKRIKREPLDGKEGHSSKGGPPRKAIGAAKGQVEKFNDPGFVKSCTLWGSIQVGEPVFARWRDKSYYSGRITKKGLNDTWYIHFEDDMEDVASEAHILPIKILGGGTRTVYCPSDCFKPEEVIVVGQRFVDPVEKVEKVEYAVVSDVDGRRINCFRRNLILKEADAKELRKEYQVPTTNNIKRTDLNLDNIVTGPRRRAGAGPPAPSDQIRKLIADAFDASSADEHLLTPWTPTPKKVSGQGGRRGSGTSGTESNASDDTRKSESKTIVSTVTETPESKTPSAPAASPTLATVKDTPKNVVKESSSKKTVKGKEKPLFHGMQFFLTASGGGDPSSSGTSGPLVTYDKDEYRETIENKGGSVVNLVGRESNKGKSQIYLISDSHARTVKYIYCLAAGIPCVSSLWIGECLKQNSIVDWKPFELNSGWSLEEGSVIPAHQKKPLKGIRIYVTAESEELYNYWKPVLIAAQANLLKPMKSRKKPTIPTDTEVLVTDATCTPEILEMAQQKEVPVVKPEWLVQTIITGQKAEYSGHEKYQVGMSDMEMGEDEGEEDEADH